MAFLKMNFKSKELRREVSVHVFIPRDTAKCDHHLIVFFFSIHTDLVQSGLMDEKLTAEPTSP